MGRTAGVENNLMETIIAPFMKYQKNKIRQQKVSLTASHYHKNSVYTILFNISGAMEWLLQCKSI